MDKNIYLIESLDKKLLLDKVKDIINKSNFKDATVTYYDLEEIELERVIEDLDTYSFLTPKKVIVIKETFFLMNSDIKFSEEGINHILKYIDNPSVDVLFILGVSKFDERKKIVKELKKKLEVIKLETDAFSFIKDSLDGYKIDNKDIRLLIDYCNSDFAKISNECKKLKLYKIDDKSITSKDIENLVIKTYINQEQVVFDLVKHIAKKDKKRIFETYNLLENYSFEPLSIIGLIESQLRLIYQVMIARSSNISNEELATITKEHPFRISKTKEFIYLYNEKDITSLIKKLSDLDYKIKAGEVDSKVGLEVFLIEI